MNGKRHDDSDDSQSIDTAGDRREWAELGRALSQAELERLGTELAVTFRQTASKIASGDELAEDDIEELYDCVEEISRVVDELASVVPGSRRPDFVEHMTDDELLSVVGRIKTDSEGGNDEL